MAEISVVVPFRGEWNSLIPTLIALNQQTIRSVLSVVLSVDGHEPPPPAIEKLVDVFVTGPQAGPASARNRGWRQTDTPFILFTDSDCVPQANWAEKMFSVLKNEYDAAKGVYSKGGTRLIQRLAQVEFEERYRLMNKSEVLYLADTYSAGFHREWLVKLNGFDESFPLPEHEDVDLSWRLVKAGGKIGFAAQAMVAHTHRKSWSEYFKMKYRRGKWRIILVKSYPARVVKDGYTPQSLKLQMLLSFPVIVSLVLLPVYPVITSIVLLLFLLFTLPLMYTALLTDSSVCFAVPFFALWRALALFSGALVGLKKGRK